jgi:hypothetical protein
MVFVTILSQTREEGIAKAPAGARVSEMGTVIAAGPVKEMEVAEGTVLAEINND